MTARTFLMILIAALSLGAAGCTNGAGVEDNGPDLGAIAAAPQTFVGKPVSMRAMPVFWTASYATADGGTSDRADAAGWLCVAIVNPRNVTQGLLVCAHSTEPLDRVTYQTAEGVRVEGPMKTFAKADLVKYMKQRHGVDLITDAGGHPLYVEMAQLPAGSTSSGAPSAIPGEQLRLEPSTAPVTSSPAIGASPMGGASPRSGEKRP